MKKTLYTLGVCLVLGTGLAGQVPDTARIYPPEAFLARVLAFHPVARQADLLLNQAQANKRMARGLFDPKLFSDWGQKSFKGSEYFTLSESGLKVPTWYGIELKGTYNTARGINVNPENTLPVAGQAVLGVRAPVLRGLFIDERRAALEQARILEKANAAERRAILNDLLLEATRAYWEWAWAYGQVEVFRRALAAADQRQRSLVESYRLGDKPGIDTLEAYIQVQNRIIDLNDALLEYQNAGLGLSNFLWSENNEPLEVTPALRPVSPGTVEVDAPLPVLPSLLEVLDLQHPSLRQAQLKISALDVDRRLAAEQLKPRLDVEYNFLSDGRQFTYDKEGNGPSIGDVLLQNYKWGINFEFPLFLRKERGKLDLTKIKIMEADYSLQQKRLELSNKVETYYNELLTTRRQVRLSAENVERYRLLLQAELRKFELGESSIFLINSREQKLIESELKLVKLQATLPKLVNGLQWAAGLLSPE